MMNEFFQCGQMFGFFDPRSRPTFGRRRGRHTFGLNKKISKPFFWLKKINRQRFFDDFRHVQSPGKVADVVAVAVDDVAIVVKTVPSHFKSLHGFFTSFFFWLKRLINA